MYNHKHDRKSHSLDQQSLKNIRTTVQLPSKRSILFMSTLSELRDLFMDVLDESINIDDKIDLIDNSTTLFGDVTLADSDIEEDETFIVKNTEGDEFLITITKLTKDDSFIDEDIVSDDVELVSLSELEDQEAEQDEANQDDED